MSHLLVEAAVVAVSLFDGISFALMLFFRQKLLGMSEYYIFIVFLDFSLNTLSIIYKERIIKNNFRY